MPQKSGFSTAGVQRSYLSAAGGLLTGLPVGQGTARQAGLGAVERLWICDFSSADSTTASCHLQPTPRPGGH